MSTENKNKHYPAFPTTEFDRQSDHHDLEAVLQGGLTKRELFAGMAMQGILANSEFLKNHKDIDIHILAVKSADDLLKQLEP